jgi:hypothetical protein
MLEWSRAHITARPHPQNTEAAVSSNIKAAVSPLPLAPGLRYNPGVVLALTTLFPALQVHDVIGRDVRPSELNDLLARLNRWWGLNPFMPR